MNISATSRPIGIKFYLKHHWGGGKDSVVFDPDWIRTLVSMATDSSHRVIMGKTTSSRFNGALLTAYLFCLPLKLPHEKERTDPGHLLGTS